MADLIQLLELDHRKVEDLFAAFRVRGHKHDADPIFHNLAVHAKAEEEIAYPIFSEFDPEAANHGTEEHDEIRQLISEIKELEGEEFLAKMGELEEKVTHHVKEEEEEVFPKAKENVSDVRLEEAAKEFKARKSQLRNFPG